MMFSEVRADEGLEGLEVTGLDLLSKFDNSDHESPNWVQDDKKNAETSEITAPPKQRDLVSRL